ncbi:MAG: YdcF family protein [Pseudomonadota bacterium]
MRVGLKLAGHGAWVILALWLGGFAGFLARLPSVASDAASDAAVALTGGPGRIEAATRLLEEGRVARILISGVNLNVTSADLERVAGIDGGQLACCIDLGRAALDTRGNAAEAAAWARAHGYRSLIVVTAGYHMPRTMLVFARAMPGVKLTPLPVPAAASLYGLAKEYSKYALSLIIDRLDLEE